MLHAAEQRSLQHNACCECPSIQNIRSRSASLTIVFFALLPRIRTARQSSSHYSNPFELYSSVINSALLFKMSTLLFKISTLLFVAATNDHSRLLLIEVRIDGLRLIIASFLIDGLRLIIASFLKIDGLRLSRLFLTLTCPGPCKSGPPTSA
jgi:hypothetical protein